jgi:hypothetical protein
MLKKLASLLFEEEEVEEPAPKPTKKKTPEPVNEEPTPLPTPTRSFESIAADDSEPIRESKPVSEPDRIESVHHEPMRHEPVLNLPPKLTPTKPTNPTPYEFRPLISPIFGVSEHEQVHRPTFVGTAEVQNDSHLQTVISPYYGAIHKDPKMKQESQPDVTLMSVHREPVAEKAVEVEPVIEKIVEADPVIENLSLEALISTEPEPHAEAPKEPEDHEQFSLFGEEK